MSPDCIVLHEYQRLELSFDADALTGMSVHLTCNELPPGAHLDLRERTIRFQPDFTQGGRDVEIRCAFWANGHRLETRIPVRVLNSITPPTPTIESVELSDVFELRRVQQVTGQWLDSPGFAGRKFVANLVIPRSRAASMPVHIVLHGYGSEPSEDGALDEIRVYPHDPYRSYWWGYADGLPDVVDGVVADYTQRRVMHLLAWVLDTVPEADPARVYVTGASMGGAGALSLGLHYARHFAYVGSLIGQTVARNHRPRRKAQLGRLWGTPSQGLTGPTQVLSAWDMQDMVAVLNQHVEARQQFIFTYHGKDDPIIHFGAVVFESPLVGMSWYSAIQRQHIGHYALWDEGGHGTPDPVLGRRWADTGWNRMHDGTTFLRRDLAFPAFTRSSADDTPGVGGNGRVPMSDASGYAADPMVAGDTGWGGAVAGALNRFLRWDSMSIVDSEMRFEVAIWAVLGEGQRIQEPGYPTTGDLYSGALPISVDVTPRRTQIFRCVPGETIYWTFGTLSGDAICGDDQVPTIAQLPVTHERVLLRVVRTPPSRPRAEAVPILHTKDGEG